MQARASARLLRDSLDTQAQNGFSHPTSETCDALSGSPRLANASRHIGVEIPPPRDATTTSRCLRASVATLLDRSGSHATPTTQTSVQIGHDGTCLGALLSLIVQGVSHVLEKELSVNSAGPGTQQVGRCLELLLHFLLADDSR